MDLTCKALYTAMINNRDLENEELRKKLEFYEERMKDMVMNLGMFHGVNVCKKCLIINYSCEYCNKYLCGGCDRKCVNCNKIFCDCEQYVCKCKENTCVFCCRECYEN